MGRVIPERQKGWRFSNWALLMIYSDVELSKLDRRLFAGFQAAGWSCVVYVSPLYGNPRL